MSKPQVLNIKRPRLKKLKMPATKQLTAGWSGGDVKQSYTK